MRVAVVDSGVEADHAAVGGVDRAVAVVADESGELAVVDDEEGDGPGMGLPARASSAGWHRTGPDQRPRARSPDNRGGRHRLAGLEWAMEQGIHVVNLSLSTRKAEIAWVLRELVDRAYFARTVVVCSAHNDPVESYPWRFASVLSVGSHEARDDRVFFVNPEPPVEFFGRGVGVEAAWLGGGTLTVTGNSFATPHLAGFCALVLGKHPG